MQSIQNSIFVSVGLYLQPTVCTLDTVISLYYIAMLSIQDIYQAVEFWSILHDNSDYRLPNNSDLLVSRSVVFCKRKENTEMCTQFLSILSGFINGSDSAETPKRVYQFYNTLYTIIHDTFSSCKIHSSCTKNAWTLVLHLLSICWLSFIPYPLTQSGTIQTNFQPITCDVYHQRIRGRIHVFKTAILFLDWILYSLNY